MRYVGWWRAGLAAVLVSGCGSSGNDTPIRDPNAPGGRMTGGSGSGSNTTPGGAFGNPNGKPSSSPMMIVNDESTCARTDVTATRVVPNVMLLLDGSGSMETCYGADASATMSDASTPAAVCPPEDMGGGFGQMLPAGTVSRWQAIRKAVADPTIGVVARLQDRVKFGVAVFGTQATCPLPLGVVMPEKDNFDAIAANVPAAPPGMFTPTGPALDAIVDLLPDPQGALDMVVEPQIVVLATDGDPNSCGDVAAGGLGGFPLSDYGPSIAAAMKLQAKNQRMYVISVGNDASAGHLQEMANIGAGLPQATNPGAPVYYPEDPTALADTLETLIGQELSCDLALGGKGIVVAMACSGTVELNGQRLECQGADGWDLKDSLHITLNGAACETFKLGADAVLHADFPCEAQIID